MGAEEGLEFPNYVQASVTLPGEITVPPVFSMNENYAVVAVADTLYHMELRHGRIHGRTGLPGSITALAGGSGNPIFAVAGENLCRIEGFEIAAQTPLLSQCTALTVCGTDPLLLMNDGSLVLRNAVDLSQSAQGTPELENIFFIQGFSGMVSISSQGGIITTLSVPGFDMIAENAHNGQILFLQRAGAGYLLFSTDEWNEIAVCYPEDLKIQSMFTFPAAPVQAAADSTVSFIYAVCPGSGIQVCRNSGEIAWRSTGYGSDAVIILADNCETLLISSGSKLEILVK